LEVSIMRKHELCAILNVAEDDTELGVLTKKRPIASLPFACRYRIIDFNLSNIAHADAKSAAIFIADSGRSLYDHIRSGKCWDLDSYGGGIFTFSQNRHKKALYEAASRKGDFYEDHLAFLTRSKANYVFVAGSKIIANLDLVDVIKKHETTPSEIVRIYKEVPKAEVINRPKERLFTINDSGKITNVVEEGRVTIDTETALLDMNMSVLKVHTLIDIIKRAEADNLNEDITDIINHYLLDYCVNSYEYKGYLANIESVKDYYNANIGMLNEENFNELFHNQLPVITKTQSGVPTYFSENADINLSQFATGCEVYGTVEESLIFRKVNIHEGAKIKNSIIMQGSRIGAGAIIEYAILDKNVVVEPGVRIIGTRDNPIVIGKDITVHAYFWNI
jgi:glucose-1-phosphate adenylyltransferase